MGFDTRLYSDKAHFIGYFECDGSLVEQAAAETAASVFASDTAVSEKMPVPAGHVAVWSEDEQDKEPFWKRLRELREEAR